MRSLYILSNDFTEHNQAGSGVPANAPQIMNAQAHWEEVYQNYIDMRCRVEAAIGRPPPYFLLISGWYLHEDLDNPNPGDKLMYVDNVGDGRADSQEEAASYMDLQVNALYQTYLKNSHSCGFVSLLDLMNRGLLGDAANGWTAFCESIGYDAKNFGPTIGTKDFSGLATANLMKSDQMHLDETPTGSLGGLFIAGLIKDEIDNALPDAGNEYWNWKMTNPLG
jgi:hypothetical protein